MAENPLEIAFGYALTLRVGALPQLIKLHPIQGAREEVRGHISQHPVRHVLHHLLGQRPVPHAPDNGLPAGQLLPVQSFALPGKTEAPGQEVALLHQAFQQHVRDMPRLPAGSVCQVIHGSADGLRALMQYPHALPGISGQLHLYGIFRISELCFHPYLLCLDLLLQLREIFPARHLLLQRLFQRFLFLGELRQLVEVARVL